MVKKDGREDSALSIEVDETSPLFKGLDRVQQVLLTHGDSVEKVGEGLKVIGRSNNCVAAVSNEKLRLYGVQFHPEVKLTTNGVKMIENFLMGVCGLTGNFELPCRISSCVQDIQNIVGNKKVILLISGRQLTPLIANYPLL